MRYDAGDYVLLKTEAQLRNTAHLNAGGGQGTKSRNYCYPYTAHYLYNFTDNGDKCGMAVEIERVYNYGTTEDPIYDIVGHPNFKVEPWMIGEPWYEREI